MDYSKYIQKISKKEDRILIQESLKIIKCRQYRAAYILIWIACVESIIRRFNEIKQFDNEAGKIYGKIIKIEEGRQATDKNIILYAKNYGFINDIEYSKLLQIYNLRCIFVHPYNQSPTKEEVDVAFANIIDIVLSKPLLLTKGYISKELDKLLNNKDYLGNYSEAMISYAEEFYQKIDKDLFEYFIGKYWKNLELYVYKTENQLLLNRGVFITQYLLSKYEPIFLNNDSFLNIILENDFIPLYVLSKPNIYMKLSNRAKDSIVANAVNSPRFKYFKIKLLEPLLTSHTLSQDNLNILKNNLSDLTFEIAETNNLSLLLVNDLIIEKLKSYNWYIQSPAIKFVREKPISELQILSKEQQETLGRNILQVANGDEKEANKYLNEIKINPNLYPINFIKGIIFEVFINEAYLIRYKDEKINIIIEIIENCSNENVQNIIRELIYLINKGKYKNDIYDYEEIVNSNILLNCSQCSPIIKLIKKKLELENVTKANS